MISLIYNVGAFVESIITSILRILANIWEWIDGVLAFMVGVLLSIVGLLIGAVVPEIYGAKPASAEAIKETRAYSECADRTLAMHYAKNRELDPTFVLTNKNLKDYREACDKQAEAIKSATEQQRHIGDWGTM